MAKTFVLSDESLNSYGFWINTAGIDLKQFKNNPLVLWMHMRPWRGTKDEILPIGTIENLRIEDKRLLGDVTFDMNDAFAKAIASKVDGGFLRMGSIGFLPIETSRDEKWLKPGQTRETVVKCRLIEFSIVDIGSNDNSLALCADPVVCDNDQKPVTLSNNKECPVKLLDTINTKNIDKMEKIALKLGLKSNATEAEVLEALDVELEKAGRVESLSLKLSTIEQDKKNAQKAEAISLIDAAILAGKIDAKAKDAQISLFEKDFEAAKLSLASLPERTDVQGSIGKKSTAEYADLEKLSFSELDKKNLLGKVKSSYPDLYKLKFKEEFGSEPTNV